jgi:hypothetical protein
MERNAIAIVALVAATALAASGALAQAPGGRAPGASGGMSSHLPPPKRDPSTAPDEPVSLTGQAQAALDKLAEELRIGARQQKAWDAYAAKVVRYADDLARARYSMREVQEGGLTVPQQLDRIVELANNRVTAVEEIADAGRALYATLGPEQRPVADKGLVTLPLRLVSGALTLVGARTGDAPPRGK